MQWKNEIEAHTDDFKVLLWHGANREQNVAELQKYDVVSLFAVPKAQHLCLCYAHHMNRS